MPGTLGLHAEPGIRAGAQDMGERFKSPLGHKMIMFDQHLYL